MMDRAPITRPPAPGRPPPCRACAPTRHTGQLGVLAALLFASCFILPPASRADPPVTVTNAWFRYILPEIPAGGYVTLRNNTSQAIVLEGASSPACGMVMLHRSEESSGVDRMVPAGRITVPPHGIFRFAPGGYHVMCMHPRMQIGQRVTVTLMFAGGSRVAVPFTVYGVNGPTGSQPNGGAPGATMKMPM